jgi:hypothetical protein
MHRRPRIGIVLAAIVLAFTSRTATARLGETQAECDKRYGSPVVKATGQEVSTEFGPADASATYRSGVLQIEVFFSKGRACRIRYSKMDGSILDPTEVKNLLNAEGGTAQWKTVDPNFADKYYNYESAWRRSDGKVLVGKFVAFMDFYDSAYFADWSKRKTIPGNL